MTHMTLAPVFPQTSLPPTVNLHLWPPCNEHCRYCFAQFQDDSTLPSIRGSGLSEADWKDILTSLRAAGVEKVTFAGGEPTLCPWLGKLLSHAYALGLVTSLITNGVHLEELLYTHSRYLDWVGLSVDSADEQVQRRLGRGQGHYVRRARHLFGLLHTLNIRTKLNTVVTALNWDEDMSDFVRAVRPERWKILQVLALAGQNDATVDPLLITDTQFRQFVLRHRHLEAAGITLAPESNNALTGSYGMIDPRGRFFSNVGGRHRYSRPILQVGLVKAFNEIQFSPDKFETRGGRYELRDAVPTANAYALSPPTA